MADHARRAAATAWAALCAAARTAAHHAATYLDRAIVAAVEHLFCRAWGLPRCAVAGGNRG